MENPAAWDDGVYSTIRRFVVYEREWICSIQIEYDQNGESIWSPKHGGNEGSISEVVLDYPDEYLISIHGYHGDLSNWGIDATVIRSLSLETNIRSYGPFGVEDGTKFSFPIKGAKIVGFHGNSGRYLDAIGVHVQTTQKIGPQPEAQPKQLDLGQYGGNGGDHWEESFHTIRRFLIYHGLWIDSIQMEYEDENGKSVWSEKHGGGGGFRSEVVLELDEHLVVIHGYYSKLHRWGIAATVIRSLTLKTNKRSYGPFGIEDGTKFSFPLNGLKIVGLHGRSSLYLDAIGLSIHTSQINEFSLEKFSLEEYGGEGTEFSPEKFSLEEYGGEGNEFDPEKFSLGEYGGKGGNPWNESFRTIKQLVIYHGLWVDSIQMEYEDENEELVWSEKHGGNGGTRSEVVLDFPDEHLVTIHGYYDDIRYWRYNCTLIRSLTVKTNKRTYGPFGVEGGTKFSFPTDGMKVVGIHGRSGVYLDAIGLSVHTSQRNEFGPEKSSLEEYVGEYGGEGGDPWNESFQTIKQLVIYHGMWVDSIQMEYEDENEELVWSEKHGGNGGSRSEVVLDFPDEHLVTIRGYYNNVYYWGYNCTLIRSLTVETNKRTYGPFGVEGGTKFSFPTDGMKVVGIHGRSGAYLDAIGLHAIPIKD